MRRAYLADIAFPDGASVLDVGCGTGAVTRELAAWPGVAEVKTGVLGHRLELGAKLGGVAGERGLQRLQHRFTAGRGSDPKA